jgi:hypothetical protein
LPFNNFSLSANITITGTSFGELDSDYIDADSADFSAETLVMACAPVPEANRRLVSAYDVALVPTAIGDVAVARIYLDGLAIFTRRVVLDVTAGGPTPMAHECWHLTPLSAGAHVIGLTLQCLGGGTMHVRASSEAVGSPGLSWLSVRDIGGA